MERKVVLARNLRKNNTVQEQKLWNLIRNRQLLGLKFKRQVPIGKYIVDFSCNEKKIVIEIDGGQHNRDKNIEYDNERTLFLEQEGYKVVRFWNNEVNENIEGVYLKLIEVLSE